MTVLVAAVGGGVVILSIGLMLDAMQAHWRGEARRWWGSRGPSGGLFRHAAGPFHWAGLASQPLERPGTWSGRPCSPRSGASPPVARRPSSSRKGLRLLVNTVSFTRVGAFALAHAGLSVADR